MKPIHIAIIHGIGKNGPGFSKDLQKGIRREFNRILRHILPEGSNDNRHLNFIEIVWDDILAPQQASLSYIFRNIFAARHHRERRNLFLWLIAFSVTVLIFNFIFKKPILMTFLAFAAYIYFSKKVDELRSFFTTEFINDIISYRQKDVSDLIFGRTNENLRPLADSASPEGVTIISHSLGTIIASEYVWAARKSGDFWDRGVFLSNFFTMGSPLPLFSLQFDGPEMFSKPITVQDPGRWVNIYDNDDPIAYPLKPLNEAYDKAVHRDAQINVGWFGLAHVNYWKNKKVQTTIASKLALDWLKLNNKITEDEFQKRLAIYDGDLVRGVPRPHD